MFGPRSPRRLVQPLRMTRAQNYSHKVSGSEGFPGGSAVRLCCQRRRGRFDPQVGKIPWRRKWQPTLVFLSGKSHGQRSLAGYSPQGCKQSDRTKQLSTLWSETVPSVLLAREKTSTFKSVKHRKKITVNNCYETELRGSVGKCMPLTSHQDRMGLGQSTLP